MYTIYDNTPPAPRLIYKTEILVIGAGQAGLSSAYHLQNMGLSVGRDFVIVDQSPGAGGAWQYRWPSLTLSTVNRIHDLPGLSFSDIIPDKRAERVYASVAVPRYYEAYEETFKLSVYRPVKVNVVCEREGRLRIESDKAFFSARGIINATGTWDKPYIPEYPGAELFTGQQLHTRDYHVPEDFEGKKVLIVGGGISALNLLDEISQVTETIWVTRRPPVFDEAPFTPERGREAVAMVEDRVRGGLPPGSVVSVTGLPVTPAIESMRKRGVLNRQPMFSEITKSGVRWEDGRHLDVDVILPVFNIAAPGLNFHIQKLFLYRCWL